FYAARLGKSQDPVAIAATTTTAVAAAAPTDKPSASATITAEKVDAGVVAIASTPAPPTSSVTQNTSDRARHGSHGHVKNNPAVDPAPAKPDATTAPISTTMPDDISHNPYR
ncbi:MAG: hypothetical protein ABI461_23500, partial [Polyangiaceae bacterium]